jgi:fused signal recognition particle receptor
MFLALPASLPHWLQFLQSRPLETGLAAFAVILLLILLILALRRRHATKEAPCASAPTEEASAPLAQEARPVPPPEAPRVEAEPAPPESFFEKLRRGLARTHDAFVGRIDALLGRGGPIGEETFEALEEILYTADLGVVTAQRLLADLRERARSAPSGEALREALREDILGILQKGQHAQPTLASPGPHVILFVGVNGVGKTTTIGKIGALHAAAGRKVLFAAGDTFRAAAIEQLEIWGGRIGAPVVKHAAGSDPSAVAFDAATAAKARGVDLLLVDTAGRLHTKVNLMEELRKMKRILARELPGAPHEVVLVLDATTGQNALAQARQFHEVLGVTGVVLTKLDGTAKGGIVIAVHEELGLPIDYVGVGEKVDDLRPWDAHAFVEALFDRPSGERTMGVRGADERSQ